MLELQPDDAIAGLPSKAFLAPMEGVMKPMFCHAVRRLGLIDMWMPPFVPVSHGAAPSRGALRRRLAFFKDTGLPCMPQILGRDPESVSICARHLADIGFKSLNLNFACPSPGVLRGGGGGALLKNPKLLSAIVSRVLSLSPGLVVGAKIRSGWDSPGDSETIIRALADSGVSFFIYHYRTVAEGYKNVDGALERIARAVEYAGAVPLFGNGDIRSIADAKRMLEACKCQGVGVARGFLKDPFILRRIAGLDSPDEESGRMLFLNAMLDSVRSGEAAWSRHNFLEVAKSSFGSNSELFARLSTVSDKEMLEGAALPLPASF